MRRFLVFAKNLIKNGPNKQPNPSRPKEERRRAIYFLIVNTGPARALFGTDASERTPSRAPVRKPADAR
jgi:hypothetical protein